VTTRTWVIVSVVVLAAGLIGYGFGRYAKPARVETRTVTETRAVVEWRDRIVEKRVEGPTHTVTRTVTRDVPCAPGATVPVTTTTTVIDAGPVVIDHVSDGSGTSATNTLAQTMTTVTQDQPRWLLQAGAAVGTDIRPAYNVGASYRLAGPLWVGGAYHLTDRRIELRAGFTF